MVRILTITQTILPQVGIGWLTITISVLMMMLVSGCSSVGYVPNQKKYEISYDQVDVHTNREGLALPALSIQKNSGNLGKIYVENGFSSANEPVLIELTRYRSLYKASAPLYYSENGNSTVFALSVERGNEMQAGIEFKFKFDFFDK